MFSTITAALLLTSTTVNAIPIWSRFSAALAVRQQQDGNATTPAEIAQGSNFFFDSLRLDDPCTTGQIACITSQLATCSQESNWEITPCTSNTTCLAVPASDNTGVFVSCIVYADAELLFQGQNASVDFGITSPPNNTATAPADEVVPIQTETGSPTYTSTDDPTDTSTPTDDPTDSSSDPAPTDAPTDSSTDSVDPTDSATDSSDPTDSSSDSADPTDSSSDSVDPTSTDSTDPAPTDDPTTTDSSDPSATCTDDAPEPSATEYETITVAVYPNPTLSGEMTTVTLSPTPIDTNSTDPTSTDTDGASPTDTDSASPDVTGTDGAIPTSIPEPDATDSSSDSESATATCTEDPSATEDPTDSSSDSPAPTDSDSSSDSATDPAPTDSISSDYGAAPTNSSSSASATDSASNTQQTGLTLTVPPNFSLPTPTDTATSSGDTPANNVAPAPSGSPDVSVVGTHFIPASPSPSAARMVRVRRS